MNISGKSLLVFGSRTQDGESVEKEIATFIKSGGYEFIITALNPSGVCEVVKHFVRSCQIGLTLVQVGLDKGRAAGMHEARSITALKMADHMLAVWDGKSKGTSGEIRMAKKMGVPCTVKIMAPAKKKKAASLVFELPDEKDIFRGLR